MVLHAYNSSFVGIGNRTVISGQPRQNLKILFEKLLKSKRSGSMSQTGE
jgi:hypothetical protein